jgi:serine/threonine-protein kinase HipA
MTKLLIAIAEGIEMGRVAQDPRGKLSFTYSEEWRSTPGAYPLSISMPLALAQHGNAKIDPFLWGLLPDNQIVLDRWGQKFHVSARNAFGLIGAVGEDCAGSIQFAHPGRVETLLGQGSPEIEWLDEAAVAARLRLLRADPSAGREAKDTGQFSLAGAQPKTPLLFENGRWGVPSGRVPTSHILKPPTGEFDGHAENEHFSLELARALGLPAADSKVLRFEDEIAIVVKRYDRVETEGGLRRVHQEDMCQALAIYPTRKYENEGGPGIRQIVELLQTNSTMPGEDINTFLDAIFYSWLIGGTDAHGKNYSLLIGGEGRARLAPLYDVASVLPYADIDPQRVKLSMKIAGEYRMRNIGVRNWRKLAEELRMDGNVLVERVDSFARQLGDHVSDVKRHMADEGLSHPIIARLAKALTARAAACRKSLHAAG